MSQVLDSGVDFAGYSIVGLLGRGGMSEVYRASNPRLGNSVAVKLLARELAQDQVFQERFVRESRLAASLNHPNVVPVFDAGEAEGLPYIAMRFVDGPDLKQLIAREGPLPLDYAVSILDQVAAALDTAHANGLIHRDVKPGNILIDENVGTEGKPHAYLSDFGVAKHSQSHSGLTSTGHFVGTIDYIAPEQIEGKPLDGTTDIYSLGCLFYECLTSVPPFERDTDVALIYAHLVEPAPSVTDKRPDLPVALNAVIATALAKRPEDRYRTCRELVAAVRATYAPETGALAAGTPTAVTPVMPAASETVLASGTDGGEAPPTTLSDEPAPAAAPPTALAASGAIGATAAMPPTEIAGAAGAAPPAPPGVPPGGTDSPTGVIDGPPTRHGAEPPVSRRRAFPKALLIGLAVLLLAGGAAAAVLVTRSGDSTNSNQTTGEKNGSTGSDVAGGVANATVTGSHTKSGTTTTSTKAQSTKAHTTQRTNTTKTTTSNRRRQTTTQQTTTSNRRRQTTTQQTTTSNRRRTSGSSSSSSSSSSDRRR